MKTLRQIIKTLGDTITNSRVCYCRNGKVHSSFSINELSQEQLNVKYSSREWFIEDNDLCILDY